MNKCYFCGTISTLFVVLGVLQKHGSAFECASVPAQRLPVAHELVEAAVEAAGSLPGAGASQEEHRRGGAGTQVDDRVFQLRHPERKVHFDVMLLHDVLDKR